MVKEWRYYLAFATVGLFFVFFLSLASNTVQTAFIRGLFGFVSFFIISFCIGKILLFSFCTSNKDHVAEEIMDETIEKRVDHVEFTEKKDQVEDNDDIIKRTSTYVSDLLKEED